MAQDLPEIGALARARDPDGFLCALFAPRARRVALWALLCFEHELARAALVASQPMLTLIRLQWWREVIEAAASGATPRRHEVVLPLHAAIAAGQLVAADLLALLDAHSDRIEAPPEDAAALLAGLHAQGGALAIATARLLGAPTPEALRPAGAARALATLLRALPAERARGRSPLPESVLEADPEASAALARHGLGWLEAARPALRALPRPAIAAALPVVLARRDLARCMAGRACAPRGFGDRLAVTWAGLRGRV